MTKKKIVMIYLETDVLAKLDRMAKQERRSRGNMVGTLVLRALQRRVKVLEGIND